MLAKYFKFKLPVLKKIKYLNKFLTTKEKEIILLLSIIGFISLFFLIARVYFIKSEVKSVSGGTYIEGIVGQPNIINPILSNNEVDLSLSKLIFSGLLKYNKKLEPINDLAKELYINFDKKKYTTCLKNDILWHDNKKLTVDDVIFTFNFIKQSVPQNPLARIFKNVKISIINENCVEFSSEQELLDFEEYLTFKILPKHIWEQIPAENFGQTEFNIKPVGSGLFKFSSLTKDTHENIKSYEFTRNDNYYNQPAYLEKIIFKFFPSFEIAEQAINNKQINGLGYLAREMKGEIEQNKNINYHQFNLPYYSAMFLNNRDDSILKEKTIRKALSYLTPKEKIAEEVFNNNGIIINGPILPSSDYFNSSITKYPHNQGLAEQELQQNGWKINEQGFWQKNNEILKIDIKTINTFEHRLTAEIIQKTWENNGIKTKLTILSPEQTREIITARDFDCLIFGILENFKTNPYAFWHSSQSNSPGLNLSGFSNRRIDELLEKANITKDKNKKQEYYNEFQTIISLNAPTIFLYNPTYTYAVDHRIKDIQTGNLRFSKDRFIEIEKWYIQTKRVIK
ncbi:peptide ABC transporter substrate-binding protein [Patescibacteria group bacterium]|nr:peptide ABC transporter substrate-binding protein [Patescibacteria group bacterium]